MKIMHYSVVPCIMSNDNVRHLLECCSCRQPMLKTMSWLCPKKHTVCNICLLQMKKNNKLACPLCQWPLVPMVAVPSSVGENEPLLEWPFENGAKGPIISNVIIVASGCHVFEREFFEIYSITPIRRQIFFGI